MTNKKCLLYGAIWLSVTLPIFFSQEVRAACTGGWGKCQDCPVGIGDTSPCNTTCDGGWHYIDISRNTIQKLETQSPGTEVAQVMGGGTEDLEEYIFKKGEHKIIYKCDRTN